MVPKENRLPRAISFSSASSFQTKFFRILIKKNDVKCNRFGFVISKKIDTRAVVRNRLRRVLQEAVRPFLTSGSGKDVLFIVKLSFFQEKSTTIFSVVQSALEKLL